MAALVDNSARAFATDNVSTLSTTPFTIAGSNRILYVIAGSGAGSPVAPTAVKWGGSGGTSLTQLSTTLTVSAFGRFSLWRLIAPTATSSTVYVDWGTNQDERLIIAVSVKDADQTTPNGTVATATGTNHSPTATATTVSGDLVLSGVYFLDQNGDANTLTVGASQTSIQEIDGTDTSFEGLGASSFSATTTSTAMSWTISGVGSLDWGMFAFDVNPAGAGPTASLKRNSQLNGLGASGPFFHNPLG